MALARSRNGSDWEAALLAPMPQFVMVAVIALAVPSIVFRSGRTVSPGWIAARGPARPEARPFAAADPGRPCVDPDCAMGPHCPGAGTRPESVAGQLRGGDLPQAGEVRRGAERDPECGQDRLQLAEAVGVQAPGQRQEERHAPMQGADRLARVHARHRHRPARGLLGPAHDLRQRTRMVRGQPVGQQADRPARFPATETTQAHARARFADVGAGGWQPPAG